MALVRYYDPRRNLIVPNVSWGMGMHECDLLILSKSGYATEIEIKISRGDLLKDRTKTHMHVHQKISRIYFALPSTLLKDLDHVPGRAGIIEVRDDLSLNFLRLPKENKLYKFNTEEMYKLARLGTLRYWGLRNKKDI